MVLGLLILSSKPNSQVAGYSITYHDCHNIKTLTTYKASSTCSNDKLTTHESQRYILLQQTSTEELHGWSCQVIYSRFTDYCGAYRHSKHVETPVIEATLDISPTQCLDMIATSTFRTPEGRTWKIELNAENKFAIEDLGTINVGDNIVTCHGQSKKVQGYVINDI